MAHQQALTRRIEAIPYGQRSLCVLSGTAEQEAAEAV